MSETRKEPQSAALSVAPCSAFRNPWSWKHAAFTIAISCFTAGLCTANAIRDDGAFAHVYTVALALFTAGISAISIGRSIKCEREHGPNMFLDRSADDKKGE